MGYDREREILVLSSDTATLAYQVKNGAWSKYNFGADCWTYLPVGNSSPGLYYTETGLTETLYMDWSRSYDVIAGTAANFEWVIQTAHKAAGDDAQVKLKNLKFTFPRDASLSDTTVLIEIIENGSGYRDSGTVSMMQSNVFTFDSSLLDGADTLGGSGESGYNRVPFPYPQAELLGVRLSATDANPLMLYGLSGQIKTARRNAAQ